MKNKHIYLLSLSLLVLLVVNPFGTNMFELAKIHFLSVFLALTLIYLVIHFFIKGKLELKYNKNAAILLGLWVLTLIISTVFSISPKLSFFGSYDRMQGLFSHLVYLGFFLLFLNTLIKKPQQEFVLKVLLFLSSLTVVHAILQQLGISIFSEAEIIHAEFMGRSFATFGHPNFLGQFLLFPIWFSILLSIQKKNRWYLLLTGFFIFGLLITRNRASILGLMLSVIIYLLFTLNIRKSFKYIITALLGSSFAGFILFFAPSLRSLETRFYLWKGGILVFPENPVFGSGLETFQLIFQKAASVKLHSLEKLYSIADRSHNEFLDILVMQGGFGLIVYLAIIVSILILLIKNHQTIKTKISPQKNKIILCYISLLVSILVSLFFGFSLVVNYLLFALFIALVLNNYLKFKTITLKPGIFNMFITGVIIAFSLYLIIFSSKAVIADTKLLSGTNKLYNHQTEQGIITITEAINLNPYQSEIFYHLSDVYYLLGVEMEDDEILNEAKNLLEYAGDFNQEDFRYYFSIARLHSAQNNFSEAEKNFLKAIELAPINPVVIKEWAVKYYHEQDYQKAADKFEELLSIIPEYWKYKIDLDTRSVAEQEKYRLFLKHIPDFWDIFSYLANSHARSGNTEKAKYYLQYVEDPEARQTIQKSIRENLNSN